MRADAMTTAARVRTDLPITGHPPESRPGQSGSDADAGEYGRVPNGSTDLRQERVRVQGATDHLVPVRTRRPVRRDHLGVPLEVVVWHTAEGLARVADVADDVARRDRPVRVGRIGRQMRIVHVAEGTVHVDGVPP